MVEKMEYCCFCHLVHIEQVPEEERRESVNLNSGEPVPHRHHSPNVSENRSFIDDTGVMGQNIDVEFKT